MVAVLLLGLMPASLWAGDDTARLSGLDTYWKELARTVREGDFIRYKACYHDEAVYVSGSTKACNPIAHEFDRWEKGFNDTRDGRMQASVEFRFSQRLGDETTAHEIGIYRYSTVIDGQHQDAYVRFEALLVKKPGWKMMMEYQKEKASKEEWDTLK